jgi:hypothetical protein
MPLTNRVFVIVPVFPEDDSMMNRVVAYLRWSAANAANIQSKYNAELIPMLLAPGVHLTLKGGAIMSYSTPKGRSSRVPKGLAIRICLTAILDLIDNSTGGVSNRHHTYIVQIDGSGAFLLENIDKVLDTLIVGQCPVALGLRTGDTWFMGHAERKRVELFENSLLENWHTRNKGTPVAPPLLDAQAGCWGFSGIVLDRISLTAPSYEIEFDLVSSALIAGCDFAFTDNLLEGTRIGTSGHTTTTGAVDHSVAVRKMPFIANKLRLSDEQVLEELLAYSQRYSLDPERTLPSSYVDQLRRTLGPPEQAQVSAE